MQNSSAIFRTLLVYGVCLPLAVLLGYLLADPSRTTYATVGVVLFLLAVPLMLRWHHTWLVATWNMNMVFLFLPGAPSAWLLMAMLSFTIALAQYILNRRMQMIYVPSVTRPLICLAVVVFFTAKLTGGMGMRVMGGDSYGGKRYLIIFCAILAYFALTSQKIPPQRRWLYTSLFLLGSLTHMISALARVANSPVFYPIFYLFPPDVGGMAAASTSLTSSTVTRFGSIAVANLAVFYAMLARYGIQEIFSIRNLWRFVLFACVCFFSLIGGFRSHLITLMLTFMIVFYLEGLLRSRLMPVMLVFVLLGGSLVLPFANRLPLQIQRTLSFLPVIPIDPIARMDAESSAEWRLHMWRRMLPQIPQYLFVGKGYSYSGADSAVAGISSANDLDQVEMAGDYHNGPLSIIIPFGIFGTIAFLWFLVAAYRVLLNNYRLGESSLRRINTFLLAYFVARVIVFFFVFGGFHGDLPVFIGLVGLSVCLNGGVVQGMRVAQPRSALNRFRMPATRPSPPKPA